MTLDEACHSVGDGRGPRITGHNSLFDGFFVQTETTANTHVLLSDRSVRSIPPGMPRRYWGACSLATRRLGRRATNSRQPTAKES